MPSLKLFTFFIFTVLMSQPAFAQTPDTEVSNFFQQFNSPSIASGALTASSKPIQPTRNVTPMLMYAKANWNKLSPSTKTMLKPWFMRPTDANASSGISGVPVFTTAQESTYISPAGHFKFHYLDAAVAANAADPSRATLAFVQQLATIADTVWTKEITTMAYNAPPSDGTKGGDAKYDIYLLNVGSKGVYGYVTSDATTYLGTPYAHSLFTHMVVDNDFSEFPQGPTNAAKVTLAHEFFHSIQNGYDREEFPAFLESLSTWMEDKNYPTIKDNLQYIGEVYVDSNGDGQYSAGESFTDINGNSKRESGSQDYPELHLDSFGLSGNHLEQYGRFMWIRYLSDKFGDTLIKSILTNTGITGGNNTYAAIDAALQTAPYNTTLATAFHEFGIWNIDINQYQNGADYPIAWGDRLFNNGAINISSSSSISLRCFPKKQKHLSTIYELVNAPNATYTFTTNGTAKVSALVPNTVGGANAYIAQPIALTAGQGSWSAPAGTAKVTFVISNTSPTDDAMTWHLTDGVTIPLPDSTTDGCPGFSTAVTQSSSSSSSSGGCLSDTFSPWILLSFAGIALLLWTRKNPKLYL